ncbi:hypothetical protein ABDK00_016980 [Niabella insulamsoli]|uniref:hypothetical protein n=1 Tax=Niabella insulamsoli TaxID=3144874 RepID=UPI0031FD22F2
MDSKTTPTKPIQSEPPKPFTVAQVREWTMDVAVERISFSRFVEILNERAFKFYAHEKNH